MRITKYSKDWSKVLGYAELTTNNTPNCDDGVLHPFYTGSCVMQELGGRLHIRTSQETYEWHQSNIHVVVDEGTMNVVDSMVYIKNQNQTAYGSVSHSFAQRLADLNGTLYAMDHGDANPRALTIKRIGVTNDKNAISKVLEISGQTMENFTGVTLGGFESSARNTLLSSFASIDQKSFSGSNNTPRNAYVAVSSSDLTKTPRLVKLTNYGPSGTRGADLTKLVKISEDRFVVLWAEMVCGSGMSRTDTNQTGTVYYAFIDGNGNQLGDTQSMTGYISDCEPIVYGN